MWLLFEALEVQTVFVKGIYARAIRAKTQSKIDNTIHTEQFPRQPAGNANLQPLNECVFRALPGYLPSARQ